LFTKIGCTKAIIFVIQNKINMIKQIINTDNAPAPIGPYNQSVRANGFLFISGQIAIDPATGNIDATDIEGETHQVMKNLAAILAEAGLDFSAVVKTTIFLTDMSLFAVVNSIYAEYFTGDHPARETVAVKGLPKAVNVEISMIAVG
jgi:2-iminobutanoate/2-iminopropanoate deaminase